MASTVQSRKAKGRRLQQAIRDWIISYTNDVHQPYKPVTEDDVKSTSMGASGNDVTLSPHAQEAFGNYAIECKNQEGFKKIYDAYKQAQANKKGIPVVFIKSNKEPILVVIGLDNWKP